MQSLDFIISGEIWIFKKKTHRCGGLDGVFTMKKNKFRAELYKTYIASGLQDPVLIQEYIEIAESFVFYQKKLTKKAYDELVEKLSKIND